MKTIYEEVCERFDNKFMMHEFNWNESANQPVSANRIKIFIKQSFLKLLDKQIEELEKQKYQQPLLGTPIHTEELMMAVNKTLEYQITSLKEQKKLIEK